MTLLALLAIAVICAFAAGTIFNVRRGSALLRWMQPGLKTVAQRATVRWLGSTAVELVMNEPRAPFTKFTMVVFLAARDLPWLWLMGRNKDLLILRGELSVVPREDAELVDPLSWSGRDARDRIQGIPQPAPDFVALAEKCGLSVRRLSVRREVPHLQLHVDAPKGDPADPDALFGTFRELALRLIHARGAALAAAAAASAAPEAEPSESPAARPRSGDKP